MVKNILKNGKEMLFASQANILSAASVIAVTILISRVLGLVKYRLLNSYFDASQIGLFFAAFRLPNIIFDLVVMGALTTAFIPVFTSYLKKGEETEANKVASIIITISSVLFLFLSLFLFIFASPLMRLITPGLSENELKTVVNLTQIMLLGQTFPLIIGNFLTGILQSHKRFLAPALAPVLYNLGIIAVTAGLSTQWGIYAPAWGVVVGAILFAIVQIPIAHQIGFRYQFIFDLKHKAVNEINKLVIPRVLGLSINQLNYTFNLALSSLIATRAITTFNYAQQLEQLPVSLFGATIAQAALPTLSEENAKDDPNSFNKTFLNSLMQIIFLTLPAAAVLIVLRIPIVRLVYGADKFDWLATVETGRTLAFFSIALVSESIVNLLVRAFYALKIARTPVVLGSLAVGINIFLSIIFIQTLKFPVWGLAASAATAAIVYSLMLLLILRQKLNIQINTIFWPIIKMIIAAGLTLFSLYIPMKLLDQLVFDTTRTIPLIFLTGIAGTIGLVVYLFLTWLFKIDELNSFLGIFGKLRAVIQKKTTLPLAQVATVAEQTSSGEQIPL